jgi:signal transduction histidine kinase
MTWTQQRRILLGFGLLALVPVLIGTLGALSILSLYGSADSLAQANRSIRKLDQVYIQLSEVEMAESDFVFTGDRRFIDAFHAARHRLDKDLKDLQAHTRDNSDQRMWMANLDALFETKIAEMQTVIDMRQRDGRAAAAEMIAARAAMPRTMDDIRQVIRRIRDTEQEQLDRRSAAQTSSLRGTVAAFGLVLLLNVGMVLSLYRAIRRAGEESRREEQRIRELNAELERRVAERTEALCKSNEDLQQFAYIVSHDLQEPLRMVGTYTELLRRRYQGRLDGDADEYIRFAVDGVKRMTALIRDVLEYSRAGQAEDTPPEYLDTNEVLESVLLNLQARIDEAGATVTHDPLPRVVAHRIWFTQVLQNLVGNALKYRGESPPRIHVSGKADMYKTTFSVRDNGIGIDPQYADQVFGIFKRLHDQTVEGTGIGLAMCKKIVERSGGKIWFESEPGSGSTFSFTVPHAHKLTAKAS